MRFKIKKKLRYIHGNNFLIFPRKFGDYYYYWMCWVTVRYEYLYSRYDYVGEVVGIGRYAKKFNETTKDVFVGDPAF